MLGGSSKKSLGYTIVELMIVLAISGLMFLIAAIFINGKAQSATFKAGVGQLTSQIQDVLEQVSDGKYSDVPLYCDPLSSPTFAQVDTNNLSQGQGANSHCVFLGKIVHFYELNTTSPENYEVFSIADQGVDSNGDQSVLFPLSGSAGAVQGLTLQSVVPQHLDISEIKVSLPDGTMDANAYNFGFYQNGSGVGLFYLNNLDNTGPGSDASESGGVIKQISAATMCITDGTRYAGVNIGNVGAGSSSSFSQLNINFSIYDTTKGPDCI
jgi:prepilin-type N-terminal cleavage/methylation domain-containing protein